MNDTLQIGEPHPSSIIAMDYIKTIPYEQLMIMQGAFSSAAIEGNRLAEICSGTLRRLINKEPVSDRYLLGLAWAIKTFKDNENICKK